MAAHPGLTKKAYAEGTGLSTRVVSELTQTWQWWLECGNSAGRPLFSSGYEMARDASLEKRAAKLGRSPKKVAQDERQARSIARNPESARIIARDPEARKQLKRAIEQTEAEETKKKVLAKSNPIELPLPNNGWNSMQHLEASTQLTMAAKALTTYIRLVHEHGPVPENLQEALLEDLLLIKERTSWAESATTTGKVDWDQALAELGEI